MTWRFTFCDLRTRRPLARLPLIGASLGEAISGPAEGKGAVPVGAAEVRRADPWAATQQRRTICFAERVIVLDGHELPGNARWAGIVWKRTRSGRLLNLSMSTPESYFARRKVAALRTWTSTDDAEIIRGLLSDAFALPGGDIGIDLPPMDAGSTSDHTADPTEDRKLLEEVRAVADAAPLEWRIVPGGNAADGFTLTLITALRLGGVAAGQQLVWTSHPGSRAGNEVINYEVTEDGSDVPNALHGAVTPSGSGAVALRTVQTTDEVDRGYPLLEDVAKVDTDAAGTQGRLDRAVRAELTVRRRDEVTLSKLTVRGDRGPDLESYTLGDTLTLRASDRLWREPVEFSGRLLARTIGPPEPGRTETVAMTLGGT